MQVPTAPPTSAEPTPQDIPHFELSVVVFDIEEHPPAASSVLTGPTEEFVDEARQLCLARPAESEPEGPTEVVATTINGTTFEMSADGWVKANGELEMLPSFLEGVYADCGWDAVAEYQAAVHRVVEEDEEAAQQTTPRAVAARAVAELVDGVVESLRRAVAEFLKRFEAEMLDGLGEALRDSLGQAKRTRGRYLTEPSASGVVALRRARGGGLHEDVKGLLEHMKVLMGLRMAYFEHERQYAALSGLSLAGKAVRAAPGKLETFSGTPSPDDVEASWGPVLGKELAKRLGPQIDEYRKGRDALLRATGEYLVTAAKRHPMVQLLWSGRGRPKEFQIDEVWIGREPTDQEAVERIAAACDFVVEACHDALETLAAGGYSLLLQEVVLSSGHTPVARSTVFDQVALARQSKPEYELGRLLLARATQEHTWGSLVPQLNPVCVWDLDLIWATTEARLREQDLAGAEEAALVLLRAELLSVSLATSARDLAATMVLSTVAGVLAPPLAPVVVGLLAAIDAYHEFAIYRRQAVLFDSEFFSAAEASRRILNRSPSLIPLLLALVNLVGDAAAVLRLPGVVKVFGRANLLLFAWSLATAASEADEARDPALQQLTRMALAAESKSSGATE
jgi:hypothetical protein